MLVTSTIWVTGCSGAGKSAVSRRLTALGHRAVSTDSIDGLCGWVGEDGRPAQRPNEPDQAWLAAHRWVWRPERLDRLLKMRDDRGDAFFLCGDAANAVELADRFDLIVLLRIDKATMQARLADPTRGNDFGRVGQSRDYVLARFDEWQRDLERHADEVVDATQDLATVVDQVIRAASRGSADPG